MKNHRMQKMTVRELQDYLAAAEHKTIILPYGLCEQHGYHLPLETDIRTADIFAEELAEKLDCLIAPTLNYTFSGGMLTGTINVSPNTFSTLVGEIIESLALQGFDNFIILPGHGGSESLLHLKESLRILKWLRPALKDKMILLVPPDSSFSPSMTKFFEERDYHAAWVETALFMHWDPSVIRENMICTDVPEVAERLRSDPDSYQLRESFTELSEEIVQTSQRSDVKVGVMGYPERATAELGAQLDAEFIDNAAAALKKAVECAGEARKSGKRIIHDNGGELKILNI